MKLVWSSCSCSFFLLCEMGRGKEKKMGKELNEQFGSVR